MMKYPFPDYPPERFGPTIKSLTTLERIPPLGPGVPVRAREAELHRFNPLTDLGQPVTNRTMAQCCHAGLWLLHNFLDESHTISQGIHTPEGSFWHAIMHRREPDPMNSKYWTPFKFVDYYGLAMAKKSADEETARWVQLLEWQLLFNYCWEKATG